MRRRHRHRPLRLSVLLVSLVMLSQGLAVQAAAPHATDRPGGGLAAAAETVAGTDAGPAVVPTEFSGDVRDLPQIPSAPMMEFEPTEPTFPKQGAGPGSAGPAQQPVTIPAGPMPSPAQNFAGLSLNDKCPTGTGPRCGSGWPPDTNGDVGPNHYIEAVNQSYAIYGKTGTLLASFTENSLFGGSGSNPCNGRSMGDPIVVYDAIADRWILSNFAFGTSSGVPIAPFYQCIAASKTGDPIAGGWWLYPIRTDLGGPGGPPVGTMNDYGKFGTWTDCLYFAANGFRDAGSGLRFNGSEFASFNRSDLYSGATLRWGIGFLPYPGPNPAFTMIPSDLSGSAAGNRPPFGTPNYFVSESVTGNGYDVRKFTPGAECDGGGTLGARTVVAQTAYGDPADVPQPGTTNRLDSLGDRLMQKVQYRKVSSAESLWAVHTVKTPSSSTVSPQWVQIDVTGGVVATTPAQEGIFSPDTSLSRWMGSIAADMDGNTALGYSTSSGTAPDYPSIAYAGRLATDPLNTLPRTEVQLVAGQGSQTLVLPGYGPMGRWGDYTAMSVDPVDDCTFWYTNQYYDSQANGDIGNWQTRIGSFRFPACGVATQVRVETAPDGSGSVVPTTSLAVGSSITAYAVSRDASGGFVANVPAAWSLVGAAGGVVGGDLVPSADMKSAVFTGHLAGTATIHAESGGLPAGDSGLITVVNTRAPSPARGQPAVAAPTLALTKGVAVSQPGLFGPSLTAPEGSTVWYSLHLTNTSSMALTGTTLTDPASGGTLPAACAPLPSPFAAGATYTCTYPATVAPGTTTNTATATAGTLSVTATATVIATPPVLADAIAPGVNRGTTGFATDSVVLPATGSVTFLVRLAPSLAGRHVEIWTRSKTGAWALTTTRTVAVDGTVHYYRRIGAWTGFQARLGTEASHGRIGTVR